MTVTVPWAYVECAIALTACVAVGALLGAIVSLLRGER